MVFSVCSVCLHPGSPILFHGVKNLSNLLFHMIYPIQCVVFPWFSHGFPCAPSDLCHLARPKVALPSQVGGESCRHLLLYKWNLSWRLFTALDKKCLWKALTKMATKICKNMGKTWENVVNKPFWNQFVASFWGLPEPELPVFCGLKDLSIGQHRGPTPQSWSC